MNWRWWSTSASVKARQPSVMAFLETVSAILTYLWLANYLGVLVPLCCAAAVAPFFLLRSDESVALGLLWFSRLDKTEWYEWRWTPNFYSLLATFVAAEFASAIVIVFYAPYSADNSLFSSYAIALLLSLLALPFLLAGPTPIILASLVIRFAATAVHLSAGIKRMPENFRVLVLCMSPSQVPELVPGLNETASKYQLNYITVALAETDQSRSDGPIQFWFDKLVLASWIVIMFLPAWLYRFTVKSTAWFWWPLAFLGGDLRFVNTPELLQWRITGSLWARTSILMAAGSLFLFLAVNFSNIFDRDNPLITPLGYLLLFDWKLRPWQISALTASILSIAAVYWANGIGGQFRIAHSTGDSYLLEASIVQLGKLERLLRFRFLVVMSFWMLAGTQALLYLNSQTCAVRLPDKIREWSHDIYGDRYSHGACVFFDDPVTDRSPRNRDR